MNFPPREALPPIDVAPAVTRRPGIRAPIQPVVCARVRRAHQFPWAVLSNCQRELSWALKLLLAERYDLPRSSASRAGDHARDFRNDVVRARNTRVRL